MRTRVGYAGGTKESPTYHSLGDHSETIEVEYDPEQIAYEDLLAIFWDSHDPTRRAYSRQYMTAVFYRGEEQETLAEESREQVAASASVPIYTEILPATEFYAAEDYHQKYYLRHERLLAQEYLAIYPDIEDFVRSTAVARVNGYVGGYGSVEQLRAEIDDLGLSAAGQQRLMNLVQSIHGVSRR